MSRYLPPLSVLIPADKLPDSLGFINTVFSKLYFRNLIVNKSFYGEEAYYKIVIVTKTKIGLNILGDNGLELLLNPDSVEGTVSEFPLSFSYYWPIIKYIRGFDLSQFDFSISAIFDLLLKVAGMDEVQLLKGIANNIYSSYGDEDEEDTYQLFIDDFNNNHNPVTPIIYNNNIYNDDLIAEDILLQMSSNGNDYNIIDIIFSDYLAQNDDFGTIEYKLERLFYTSLGLFKLDYIFKDLLTPKISASLDSLSLALAFPRTWLKPIDPATNEPYTNENIKSMLKFNVGSLHFSTENGLEFKNENHLSFDKSEIGNTGLTLFFSNMKFDLSKTSNIPEATAAGYSDDFRGVFVESAEIGLPKKWFGDSGTALELVGENLLIGTGGFSGTIGLNASNTTDGTLWKNLGGDGFRMGFTSFDITFKQNTIISSNIRAKLEIPKFQNKNNQPLQIDVIGSFANNGDFNLTAAMSPGLEAKISDFVNFKFNTFEIGRQGKNFYLGTSCDVWFPDNSAINKIIGNQKIVLPKVRIYSNGKFELVGGNAVIPTNINLTLGPINVAVTGINFGSYQRKVGGVDRQYNYWGFDGAISINPLGIDVRGDGVKYYYTVDGAGDDDSFLHIQTIAVDLVIPGNVSPDKAAVIINGMVSIPAPGVSPEYKGSIALKIPKVKIGAGAAMRLAPKRPAFIVDAIVDLPSPIPIGPVGIYAFRAILGFRYVAEKEAVGLTSGKHTWYDYFVAPPQRGIHIDKFSGPESERVKNSKFPFSLGAGAVLGTSVDGGKIISVRAMLILSLPSMFMI
jgi:hypothetical protein